MYSGNERAALVGKAGEDFVAQYLKSKGYIIIKRNWRDSRFGELDIVAENRECIAFVEVKTRQKNSLVSGAEAVDNAADAIMCILEKGIDKAMNEYNIKAKPAGKEESDQQGND